MARNFKGKSFTKILRGYAPEEVEGYIAYIDEEYKKLEKTSADNTHKLALVLRKLDEMNNYADDLENQLDEQARGYEEQLATQKQQIIALAKHIQKRDSAPAASDAADKAKKEAEAMVADAQLKAEKIIADAEELARSMREKIIAEATAKAEQIVNEAEQSVAGRENVAQDMSVAAVDIYNEICAFRDTLFAAYNTHIESIEEITAAAEVLIADTNATVAGEESEVEELDEEASAEGADLSDEEILASLGLDELEELDDLLGDVEPKEETLSSYDTLVTDEADFCIVDDETDFENGQDNNDDGIVIDENGFIILPGEEDETEPKDDFVVASETFKTKVEEIIEEDEIPFDVDDGEDFEVVAAEDDVTPENDTYESYETYGEIDENEIDDTIDNLAQKYSTVYTDSLDEEDFEYVTEESVEEVKPQIDDFEVVEEDFDDDDGSYAPDAEYAWGDDMYAEPDESVDGDYAEESEDIFYVEDSAEEVYEDEMDELDKLKQFFSADFSDSESDSKVYDTTSNSTTSIALSLNDFFEEGEMPYEDDFEYEGDQGVESLFERDDDPLSVTDEFNIIFANMDSKRNVEEISRQPIIPAEEPKNPKKHRKF